MSLASILNDNQDIFVSELIVGNIACDTLTARKINGGGGGGGGATFYDDRYNLPPSSGGGGWVGTATSQLAMADYPIENAQYLGLQNQDGE